MASLRDLLDATGHVLRDLQATRWVTLRAVGDVPRGAVVYVIGWAADESGARLSIRWGPEGDRVEHDVDPAAVERWDPEVALS